MKPLLLLLLVTALVAAGCTGPGADVEISHVHGMAFEPTSGAVFLATHNGLAKGAPAGDGRSWDYVGSDRYDYMGFTQDAERPGVFYSSGHPSDPQSFGGVHLGLRRSTDGGQTWEQRSLKGEVDFHALSSIPGEEGWLAGHWQETIKVSRDGGATWSDNPAPPARVVALAGGPERLLAGTAAGLWEARDLESFGDWTAVDAEGLPSVVIAVAVSTDGQTLFASAVDEGAVKSYSSNDGGATWTETGPPGLRGLSSPVLFAVDPTDADHVFASTTDALVMESKDRGATWTTIRDA